MSRLIYTSTKSRKKPNKKPGWREAEEKHRKWLLSMGVDPDAPKPKKVFQEYTPQPEPYRRGTENIPSCSNKIGGVAPKKETPVYSGDYIVGIATMHKSNIVPVGRGEDARDYATMRRS